MSRPEVVRRVPGEAGVWVLILGDLLAFGIFFVAFGIDRTRHPDAFAASGGELSVAFGLANTLVLLLSSLFVATGVRALRAGAAPVARRWLLAALVCGLVFVVDKGFEYGAKLDHGLTPSTDRFFSYYYALTGLHLVHVLAGIVVLAALVAATFREPAGPHRRAYVEGGACFWHMVDLIWLVLFPLLYLAP